MGSTDLERGEREMSYCPSFDKVCIVTDEKRAKIGSWLNMRSVCCVFLGIKVQCSLTFLAQENCCF